MVDCHCEDIHDFIDEVNGLDFENKSVSGPPPLVTQSIPIVPNELFDYPSETIPDEIVGIRLEDVLSPKKRRNSAKIFQISDDVRVDLSALDRPIFHGKKVILFATGPDVIIEGLWWRRNAIDLFTEIAKGGFYAVTGMNFSLFLYECPLGHLINLNKSLVVCEELSRLGLSVLPHVYAVNDTQRDMWVEYLHCRPNNRTVLINTQMQRNRASMHETEKTILALLNGTSVNIIVNGYFPSDPKLASNVRVIHASQQGLKKKEIIDSAIRRHSSMERLILADECSGLEGLELCPRPRRGRLFPGASDV
ncbi:hypothetical protein FWF89_02150 [Candidatus Saccharibacteria bacterium]|nr:hypothetical protein [Candidatus Saccharibacteria bacterium]